MRIGFIFIVLFSAAGCGVKKAPDTYYSHPLQFDDAPPPRVSPTPGVTNGFNS